MTGLTLVGLAMVLVGFAVVLLAIVASARGSQGDQDSGKVKGGGVVMIGPIPIIFGSDAKWASIAIFLAIVLIVLALLSGVLVR